MIWMAVDKNIIVAGLATVAGLAILTKTPVMRREAETVVFNARGFPKKLKIYYSYYITPDAITKFFQPTTGWFYRIRDVRIDENYKFVKQNLSYFMTPNEFEYAKISRLFDIYNDSSMPRLFFADIIMRKKNIDVKTIFDGSKGYYKPLYSNSYDLEKDYLWITPYCEDLFKGAPTLSRQKFDELGTVKLLATYDNGKFAEELWNCYTNGEGFSKDVDDIPSRRVQLAMTQIYRYLFGIPYMDKDIKREILLFTDEQKEESLANRKSESEIYEKHMDFVRKLYDNWEYNPNYDSEQYAIDRMLGALKQQINLVSVSFGGNYFDFNVAYYETMEYKQTGQRDKKGVAYRFPLTAEDMISLYEWYYLKMYYYFYNASQPLYKELNGKDFDYKTGLFLNNIRGDWYAYRNSYDAPSRYNSIVKPITPLKEIAERGYTEGFIKKTIIKKRPFFTSQIAKENKEWDKLLSGGRDEKAQKNAKELKDELAKNEPYKGLRLYQSYAFSEALKSLKNQIESAGNLITESEKQQAITALKNAQERDITAEIAKRKQQYDNEVRTAKQRYDNEEARLKRQQNQNEINLKNMKEELDED